MATTEWQSITLGQNKTIQDIAEAASKASELLDANVKLAQGTLKAAGIFLTGLLGPYILLLRTTADTIDDFVKDFKNIGFFVLEVTPDGKYLIPKKADGNPVKLLLHSVKVATNAQDRGDFVDYKYTAGINDFGAGTELQDFQQFQIKLVMQGTNAAAPPRIMNLRGIALAT